MNTCTNDNWNVWHFSKHTERTIRSTFLLAAIWKFCKNQSPPETSRHKPCKNIICWSFSTSLPTNHHLSLSMKCRCQGKAKWWRKSLKLKKVLKIHVLKIPVCFTNPSHFCWSSNQIRTKVFWYPNSALMFTFSMDLDMTSKAKFSRDITHITVRLPHHIKWVSGFLTYYVTFYYIVWHA